MRYAEKLRDPRWQKLRLEVFERDGWACRICGGKDKTLIVHHMKYAGEPWEAPQEWLQTLCEDCHVDETEKREDAEQYLLDGLRETGFLWGTVWNLGSAIRKDPWRIWRTINGISSSRKRVHKDRK